MFEKIGDFFKRQIRNAFHAVTKSFRAFFPLVLSIFLIECIFFTVFLAFDHNKQLQTQAVESTYDYHFTLSGLDNVQLSQLHRYQARSETSVGHYIIKHEDGSVVHIKLLTGNKINTSLFDRDDTLEGNYKAMREELLPTVDIASSASFTPLYTLEDDLADLNMTRNIILLALGALFVIVFISFYSIYLNNQKYTYGLYAAFGGKTIRLCINACFELSICALFALLPAFCVGFLLCWLLYLSSGVTFAVSFFGLLGIALSVFLLMVVFLFIGASIPIKKLSLSEPMLLIDAQNNSNLVVSPRRSFNLLRRSFPFGYELISIWRFRKYHIALTFSSALLCVCFVLGFFSAAIYQENNALKQRTDHDFDIKFTNVDVIDDSYASYFANLDGVASAYKGYDETSATELANLLLIDKKNVINDNALPEDEEKKLYYTGDAKYICVTGNDALEHLTNTYTVTGNPGDLSKDDRNILIGSTFKNVSSFAFSVGDTVRIAIPLEDENGNIVLKENAEPIENVTNKALWEQQYEKIHYRYETFTIVGIIEDYPSGAEGVPIVFNTSVYENITQKTVKADTLYIKADDDLSLSGFISLEARLNTIADNLSSGKYLVMTRNSYFSNKIQQHFCFADIARGVSLVLLAFIPMTWFYSQGLFFKRRYDEFYSLHSASAPLRRIRSIFICDCLFLLPIGLFSAILAVLVSLLMQWFFSYVLPSIFQFSSIVVYKVSLPIWVYLLCIVFTFIPCFLSALFPYMSYRKQYKKALAAETLDEKNPIL